MIYVFWLLSLLGGTSAEVCVTLYNIAANCRPCVYQLFEKSPRKSTGLVRQDASCRQDAFGPCDSMQL